MQTDALSAFNSLKKHKKTLQINSVGQKFSTVWWNFPQGSRTPGTQRDIVFSQLSVKGLKSSLTDKMLWCNFKTYFIRNCMYSKRKTKVMSY
jgi:hypothetical protein